MLPGTLDRAGQALLSAHDEDGRLSSSNHSLVGLVGKLVIATRGADGAGEVKLRIRGGTEHFLARSREPIAAGTTVMVLTELGPRTVEVLPWDDPFENVPNP